MTRVFTQTFGVVGGILERDGKILLVREAQEKGPDAGKWNHPAGWIEVGENPIEAVKREVLEESGFTFAPKYILGIYSLVRKDIEKETGFVHHPIKIIFVGDISEFPSGVLEDDVTEARWFPPNEIYDMDNKTLRDLDIKQMVKDYFVGKKLPLEVLTHSVATAD
ncbi:MAG: NUDIX domain-containing protein [bacterium]|nr:NUDIX domain-containing protein [bacterium]